MASEQDKKCCFGEQILIVDDEKAICAIIAQRLKRESCSCVTAKSGKESFYYLYRDKFSMMISDIHMPEMNGIEFLKQVKQMNPDPMVIVVTACPRIAVAREAIQLGMCDFISGFRSNGWANLRQFWREDIC